LRFNATDAIKFWNYLWSLLNQFPTFHSVEAMS
jgi:hypothetical protein